MSRKFVKNIILVHFNEKIKLGDNYVSQIGKKMTLIEKIIQLENEYKQKDNK